MSRGRQPVWASGPGDWLGHFYPVHRLPTTIAAIALHVTPPEAGPVSIIAFAIVAGIVRVSDAAVAQIFLAPAQPIAEAFLVIPVAIIPAIFAAIPTIFTPVPATFTPVPATFTPVPAIFTPIPAIFTPIPTALRLDRRQT
jgi:hypothetical protein